MSQAQLCLASTANPTEKREKPGYAGYYDNEKDKKKARADIYARF